MDRLTHIADFGLEDWDEILYLVKGDLNGAYNILDIARFQGKEEFDEILKNISLRLAAYEDTGLEPEKIKEILNAVNGGLSAENGIWCPKCGDALDIDIVKKLWVDCSNSLHHCKDNHYCSYGERKESNE